MQCKPLNRLNSDLDSARENCEMEFRVGDTAQITKKGDEETQRN